MKEAGNFETDGQTKSPIDSRNEQIDRQTDRENRRDSITKIFVTTFEKICTKINSFEMVTF